MFDVGGGELVLILLAIVVLFGPKRLPEFSRMVGKGMQQLRKAQAQFQEQMDDIRYDIDKSFNQSSENSLPKNPKKDE